VIASRKKIVTQMCLREVVSLPQTPQRAQSERGDNEVKLFRCRAKALTAQPQSSEPFMAVKYVLGKMRANQATRWSAPSTLKPTHLRWAQAEHYIPTSEYYSLFGSHTTPIAHIVDAFLTDTRSLTICCGNVHIFSTWVVFTAFSITINVNCNS
jgi:hypothetical protein